MAAQPPISLSSAAYNQGPSRLPGGIDPRENQPHGKADEGHAHPVPKALLIGVFVALLALTGLTVAVGWVEDQGLDFGALSIAVALGIATVKAAIVALFFMHLWWDSKFNALALLFSIGFVALFIGIAILDTNEYQPALEPPGGYAAQAELTGS